MKSSSFPALLEAFFTDRLQRQRNASPHTIAAYRDTFRLLLRFGQKSYGRSPSLLQLEDLHAAFIGGFLNDLEQGGSCARTRNVRLAAIRSFFRFLALEEPAHAALIQQVLAIPNKRHDRAVVEYLTLPEVEALLAAPAQATWSGRRDHAMLLLDVQTGLRVSELIGLQCQDVCLQTGAHVRCRGKGRKERCTPLTRQVKLAMKRWIQERQGKPTDPLFPSQRGAALSSDGFQYILATHTRTAQQQCTTLVNKRVSPHVLRHTAAMFLLQSGVDRSVIALWLGHESIETTQVYLDADMAMKEAALRKTQSLGTKLNRFKPDDDLMGFLTNL